MNTRSKRQSSVNPPGQAQSSKRTARRAASSTAVADDASSTSVSLLTSLPAGVASTLLSFLTGNDILKCMRVNRWFRQQIYIPSSSSLANIS